MYAFVSENMLGGWRRAHCRRLDEFDLRKRLRQLPLSRRIFAFVITALFFLYFLLPSFGTFRTPTKAQLCIDDRMHLWQLLENDNLVSSTMQQLAITGNGYIGMGRDGELRLKPHSSRVLSLRSGFYPLITPDIQQSTDRADAVITDYRNGVLITINCFSVDEKCACITHRMYAHRSRAHVFIQEIQTTNPTDGVLSVDLSVKSSQRWVREESFGDSYVYTNFFDSDGSRTLAAVVCSNVPPSITVEKNLEDSIRFTCVINHSNIEGTTSKDFERKQLGDIVVKFRKEIQKSVKEFAEISNIRGNILDQEHQSAWAKLNIATFGISKSLAPDALNSDVINATRFALLCNTRDFIHEVNKNNEEKQETLAYLQKIDMCYTGHSTLLVPSRLWKKSRSLNELLETVDVWFLTLEKRGCSNLLKAGASGVAQAFTLSLLASKFSHDHLEVTIDPADLHREITVNDLSFSLSIKLAISIHLNQENRPYINVHSSSEVYACDAACINPPILVGTSKVKIPVKVTRPLTPILYFSKSKRHLEQLRGTIHIIEMMDAPAHEHGLIALHKHGHRLGGLPMLFWVMLGALIIAFHLFLVKLIYSEWKKGDVVSSSYYARQRYLRNH